MIAAALRRLPAELWLLVAIFAVMLPLRVYQTMNTPEMGIDGGYYVEVARHVRDGLGLSTHVSLYHAGDSEFPHPTSIYPLWPLLLGYAARLIDLAVVAHWLPLGLAMTSLVLGYRFGRRLWPDPLLPSLIPGFNAGHVLVLTLGLQKDFIEFTSLPFTEPLAWTLLFACFLRALVAKPGLLWALELGLWCGLIYLCRAQLIVVAIAAVLASGLAALLGPDRPRALLRAAATTGVVGAVLAGWWLWLRTFVHDAGFSALLRFDQNRANDLLEPFDVIVDAPGPGALLLDRAAGLVHGWDIISESSYAAGFYASHWALPIAMPALVVAGWRLLRGEGLRGVAERLRGPEATARVFIVLAAAGGLASVQLVHKHFNGEWYFNNRQSMICALPFFLTLVWLLRQSARLPLLCGGAILATSTLAGVRELADQAIRHERGMKTEKSDADLARWLNRRAKDGPLTVVLASGKVQRVAWRTEDVGYHWFYEKTSYEDLLAMTDRLGATYVIYGDDGTEGWRFHREGAGALARDFETVPHALPHINILKRRGASAPSPSVRTPRVVVVGVDGASWKVMEPMIAEGELPTFARLRLEGASQLDFDTLDKTDSPVVWTTVATGRSPEEHGVEDYTITLADGAKVPITSDVRKVPALWNLASDAGLRVLAINWWASWPAEAIHGIVVSDHANPAAAGWMKDTYWDADPAALAALKKDTWPPELADALAGTWIRPEDFPLDELQSRAKLSPEQLALVQAASFNVRETYSWFKTFYALDRPHLQIALDQLREAPPELTMLYLRGPDPVQHYAWNTVEPYLYERLPKTVARDAGVVQGVYRYVDSFLAELLDAVDENTVVIVLSDHGAEPARGATRRGFQGRPGGHTREAKGVLFFWGANVQQGARILGAGPLDIAPTVAWLLGLPVAEDLDGRVLVEAFNVGFQRGRGLERVPTWGQRVVEGSSTASPADANMLEQLRGLGYIE